MTQTESATGTAPHTFGIVLVPGFSQFAFASAVEPLRAANEARGESLYDWHVLSPDGAPVPASSGVRVACDASLSDVGTLDTALVVSGKAGAEHQDAHTIGWLRERARRGARIGAVSTGTYVLAQAGLLQAYRCTIHWKHLGAFAEMYPEIDVSGELYEIDRNRLTCAGGEAAFDMMLALIGIEHGRELAVEVAENFMHERIRESADSQRMALRTRLGLVHPKLLNVVELMEQHLEEPLSQAELARQADLSTRQLERLFRQHLNRTPNSYYQKLRLQAARSLLNQTSMSVTEVALACGFVSASHFSKCYRRTFGRTPRQDRGPFNGAMTMEHASAEA